MEQSISFEAEHLMPLVTKFFSLNFVNYQPSHHYGLSKIVASIITSKSKDNRYLYTMMAENKFYKMFTTDEQRAVAKLILREQEKLKFSSTEEMLKHLLTHEIMWHTKDIPVIHIIPFMIRYVDDIIKFKNKSEWISVLTNREVCYLLLKRYINHDDIVIKNIARRISSDIAVLVSMLNFETVDTKLRVDEVIRWLKDDADYCYNSRTNVSVKNLLQPVIFSRFVHLDGPPNRLARESSEEYEQVKNISQLYFAIVPRIESRKVTN